MKNKKIITMVASVAMVAVIGVGATMAYFTDTTSQTNTVAMGNVQIALHEYKDGNMTEYFEDLKNVVPNTPVKKIPVITNVGKNPCYVRALIKITNPEGLIVEAPNSQQDLLTIEDLGINGADWYIGDTREDGYTEVYYQHVLTSVDKAILFQGFTIPNWDNAVADKSLSIDIKAEAIQSEYFDPIRDEKTDQITSWEDQNIIAYKA